MSDSEINSTAPKKKRMEQYLDTYIRREMLASYKDYLLNKARRVENGVPVQTSISLAKIVRIAMVYHSKTPLASKDITKMIAEHAFENKDPALYGHYKRTSIIAKKIYSKHKMALLRIEESFFDRGLQEGGCLALKLLYLTGCELPDERGRMMEVNTNKASLELGHFLDICNMTGSSEEYQEREYRYKMGKAVKKAKKDITEKE